MLKAAFLEIMLFGWERVNPAIPFMSTILVAVGANLSKVWILTAKLAAGTTLIEAIFMTISTPIF